MHTQLDLEKVIEDTCLHEWGCAIHDKVGDGSYPCECDGPKNVDMLLAELRRLRRVETEQSATIEKMLAEGYEKRMTPND